jgi:HEAT repeat protein
MKLAWLLVSAVPLLAQQPRISNARLETREVSGRLDSTFQAILNGQKSPAWVGYAEPLVRRDIENCCCWPGNRRGDHEIGVTGSRTLKLEGPTELVVLFRVENHQIGAIQTSTPECDLDAGGLPFIWLTGVRAQESIRFLEATAQNQGERAGDAALAAIALHADAAADTALEKFAAANQPEKLRRQAIFWLGSARGRRGFEIVSRMARQDQGAQIREHAVFALALSKEAEAPRTLAAFAHDDSSPRVRGQALFWLAQKAGQKVAESAIGDAIANDPETGVKKQAVFALTQMPNGEGVPLLIQIARTNRNPEVRKQAMFWLGQSRDPRALAFIEDVLK